MRILFEWFSPRQARLLNGGLIILLILAAWAFLKVGFPFIHSLTLSEQHTWGSAPRRTQVSETIPEESTQGYLKMPERASELPDEEHAEVHYYGPRPDVLRDEAEAAGEGYHLPSDHVEVHNHGSVPDVLRNEVGVIEGRYPPDDDLKAHQLLPEPASKDQMVASSPSPRLGSIAPSDFSCDSVSEIPQAECEALVALYNSTDGPHWRRRTGWLETATPCSWYGVTCSDRHVTSLELFDNQLNGSIPSELGNLAYLVYLRLSSNALSGTIPIELGNLVNLTTLILYDNQLSGPIPPELGNLEHLEYLGLFSNALSGSIPGELGELDNLKMLILYDNQLSGPIPPELGNLTSLTHLRLYNNQLSGPIPPELGNLTSLTDLVLKSNQLSGSIPPALGNLSHTFKVLYLSCNQLSGEVPYTITRLVNLQPYSTDLGYNMLMASDSEVKDFLDDKDRDWAQTQTVTPTDVHVVTMTHSSVELGWNPIAYTGDGGYYEVGYTTTPGGPYTVLTTTEKTAEGYRAEGVSPCASDGFTMTVRTYTPAHGYPGHVVYQQNDLWSDYEEVSIVPLPPPTLSSPPNDSNTFAKPTFTWNRVGGATSYRIQVATDESFSPPFPIDEKDIPTTSYDTSTVLSEGVTYYWHVRASNFCGDGPWSEVWEFTVRSFRLVLPFVTRD